MRVHFWSVFSCLPKWTQNLKFFLPATPQDFPQTPLPPGEQQQEDNSPKRQPMGHLQTLPVLVRNVPGPDEEHRRHSEGHKKQQNLVEQQHDSTDGLNFTPKSGLPPGKRKKSWRVLSGIWISPSNRAWNRPQISTLAKPSLAEHGGIDLNCKTHENNGKISGKVSGHPRRTGASSKNLATHTDTHTNLRAARWKRK